MALRDLPSPNHGPRAAAIDMLVVHYTGMRNATEALARLTSLDSAVSAHYLIDEDGTVWRLVPEERRAWHAGISFWRGRRDINSASIGIELVNPGHEFGYRAFPEAQLAALEVLARDILGRHAIPPHNVLGHSDVAPARKQDPGELFPWRRLALAGIGVWPGSPLPPAPREIRPVLGAIGYDPDVALAPTITAFQRHFRPIPCDGVPDEETRAMAAAIANLYRGV
ncbi:MAG TPA: N-acetylmuramoyl-L-alanine amidase [Stellaceae bacterium]|nr:N-acetylmuramoyl-L-alanine amidase [Stellaceae bacterium]